MDCFLIFYSLALIFVPVYCQFYLDEGDFCENENGSQGICKSVTACPILRVLLKQNNRPKICSFHHNDPVVCCPKITDFSTMNPRPSGSKLKSGSFESKEISFSTAVATAKQKCAEYAKYVIVTIPSPIQDGSTEDIDLCGINWEALIGGGEIAVEKEFPHMALIGYGDDDISWQCGGSLVSERFVLSAAHCSYPVGRNPAQWVKLGEYDTSTDTDDAYPVVIKIDEIINHPNYIEGENFYNDIALYKLKQSVHFNAYVRPICLPIRNHSHLNTAIASGWGYTQFGGRPSSTLMKVRLNLVENEVCNKKYINKRGTKIPNGIVYSQICAGNITGKDSCLGDSGGPLQSPLSQPYCMYEILGVTSFGVGCAIGYPGVYTNVLSYLPWIVQHVWSS